MNKDQKAREAQERAINVYTKKPETALETDFGTAKLRDGLNCKFTQDGASVIMDMAEAIGGDANGPTPGFFGRAAITGCIAIGIKMTAIRDGLKINGVDVKIEMDFDYRGIFGIQNTPAAPLNTRILISVDSREPKKQIDALVERALSADPWFLSLKDAQKVSTQISVLEGE